MPSLITDELKNVLLSCAKQWLGIKGYLVNTCLVALDQYKVVMGKFGVENRLTKRTINDKKAR